MAKHFGATTIVNASEQDPAAAALANGRGADVAFEVIGLGATMEQAINVVRPGGEVVLVGVPRMDVFLNLNAAFTFLYMAQDREGLLVRLGRRAPRRTQAARPLPAGRARARRADLAARSTSTSVNEAFEAMEKGEVARSVVNYGLE